MFKKIRNSFYIWKEMHFGEYKSVREFDFAQAQNFYEKNKGELMEMAFCMGFDQDIWSPIVEDGATIKPPICFSHADGVVRTFYDVPCFYYQMKSGKHGKMYCFKEYSYNAPSQTFKYVCLLGVPQKVKRFGVFCADQFENRMRKMYGEIE